MKFRKTLKIVACFIVLLCMLSFFITATFYMMHRYVFHNQIQQNYDFWEFSLYMLGYGSSPDVQAGMQLLLGIIGIVMVSLLSAFLTVNLFRRA